MTQVDLKYLAESMKEFSPCTQVGRVAAIQSNRIDITGLNSVAALGNWVRIYRQDSGVLQGEIVSIGEHYVSVLADGDGINLRIGDRVRLGSTPTISPDSSWLGRVVDPFGRPLDGKPLVTGCDAVLLEHVPPPAHARRGFGSRLRTGLCAFNTALPIVRGQRIGLF